MFWNNLYSILILILKLVSEYYIVNARWRISGKQLCWGSAILSSSQNLGWDMTGDSSSQIAFIEGVILGPFCTQKAKIWLIFIPSSPIMKKVDCSWVRESLLIMGTLSQDTGFISLARTLGAGMALGSLEEVTSHRK